MEVDVLGVLRTYTEPRMTNQDWWELQGIEGMLPEVQMLCGESENRVNTSGYAGLRSATPVHYPTCQGICALNRPLPV
jgi:hypothetical protein